MIHFSERLAVCNLYDIWLRRHPEAANDPLSLLAFMQVYNLINEEEFKKVCNEYFKKIGGNYEHIND